MPIFYDLPLSDIRTIFAPKYDGNYIEDGVDHRTWLVHSDDDEMMYVLDRNEETGEVYCTCAGNGYKGKCKHKEDLDYWGEQ